MTYIYMQAVCAIQEVRALFQNLHGGGHVPGTSAADINAGAIRARTLLYVKLILSVVLSFFCRSVVLLFCSISSVALGIPDVLLSYSIITLA